MDRVLYIHSKIFGDCEWLSRRLLWRGLRQSDPLSPLLFVLVMEAFSRMMKELVENGSIEGFDIGNGGRGGKSISHLLFADDTLILCGIDDGQFRNLRCLLLCLRRCWG